MYMYMDTYIYIYIHALCFAGLWYIEEGTPTSQLECNHRFTELKKKRINTRKLIESCDKMPRVCCFVVFSHTNLNNNRGLERSTRDTVNMFTTTVKLPSQ